MKKATLLLMFAVLPGVAFASETCEQMQTRIKAQMTTKAVKHFALTTVKKDDLKIGNGKVVGHCGKGKMVIVFNKSSAANSAVAK